MEIIFKGGSSKGGIKNKGGSDPSPNCVTKLHQDIVCSLKQTTNKATVFRLFTENFNVKGQIIQVVS